MHLVTPHKTHGSALFLCRHACMTEAHPKNRWLYHSLCFTFTKLLIGIQTQALSVGNAQTLEGPLSQQGDYKDILKMIQVLYRHKEVCC